MKTNTDLKKETQFKKIPIIVALFFCFIFETGFAQSPAETEKLLSRFDLSKPGLEKVKQSANNPEQAATELLNYFKKRNSVKHFVTLVVPHEKEAPEIQIAHTAIESGKMEIKVFENGEKRKLFYTAASAR